MSSARNTIELQQYHGPMRTQHGRTFPVDRPSLQGSTCSSSTESYRDYRESLPQGRQPNDDYIAIESPLLSSELRATPDIDGDAHTSGTDRIKDHHQSRRSFEHSASPSQRPEPRASEEQRDTDPKPEEAKKDTRVPKHITRGGWNRYLHGWIVHIPALLMTVTILVTGSWKFYWYSEQGPLIKDYRVEADTISNVLQLVAKLHELFIVASLSSIAMNMFRRSLITRGIRLGFLTGGYRVGDLAYLKTAAFWRQGLDMSNFWGFLLPGFVVFATIMSTIVGPASAVLLVPTLGWYKMDTSNAFSKVELPLLYTWDRTNVWYPGRHDAPDKCDGVGGLYQVYCPAGAFQK